MIDLEARHEDLLVRLDELDKRVAKTLAECQRYRILPRENPHDSAHADEPGIPLKHATRFARQAITAIGQTLMNPRWLR